MNLSNNFTLAEICKSGTALRCGIVNTPGDNEVKALEALAGNILQPVRDHFDIPFSPSSGFRCLELNTLIKSKPTSQHVKGEAVDFEVPGVSNLALAEWIRDNLEFDQLIVEFWKDDDPHAGWVHCSYKGEGNRKQVLTIGPGGALAGLGAY